MGTPKAHLTLKGRMILEFLLDRWRWPGPTMLVTAPGRGRPPGWGRFTVEVSDPVAGSGPLRGVLTALENVATDLLVVTTCDMPFVGAGQFRWLIEQVGERKGLSGVMTRRGETIEPFPLALRAGSRDVVAARYASGQRSTQRLAELAEFAAVPAPQDWPDATWTNLNSPEDLARFEASP